MKFEKVRKIREIKDERVGKMRGKEPNNAFSNVPYFQSRRVAWPTNHFRKWIKLRRNAFIKLRRNISIKLRRNTSIKLRRNSFIKLIRNALIKLES